MAPAAAAAAPYYPKTPTTSPNSGTRADSTGDSSPGESPPWFAQSAKTAHTANSVSSAVLEVASSPHEGWPRTPRAAT